MPFTPPRSGEREDLGRAAWVRRTPWGLATVLYALVITAGLVMSAASSLGSPVELFVGILVWACSAMPVAGTHLSSA